MAAGLQGIREASMDILGDVLLSLRLLSSSISTFDLAGNWGIEAKMPPNIACCYTVLEGPCWFKSADHDATKLEVGDSIMILNEVEHSYMASPDAHLDKFLDVWNSLGLPHGPPMPNPPKLSSPKKAAIDQRKVLTGKEI